MTMPTALELEAALQRVQELETDLAASERNYQHLYAALDAAQQRYQEITTGRTWRLVKMLLRCRNAVLPTGSRRARMARWLLDRCVRPGIRPSNRAQFAPTPPGGQALLDRLAGRQPIIFLPSVPWSLTLFQRPHHLARAFARLNRQTIFNCNWTSEKVDGVREIEPNLFLYKGPSEFLQRLRRPILWAFTYNFAQRKEYDPEALVVYDWIDDLGVFPFDLSWLRGQHETALRHADLVASVARKLHADAARVRPDAIFLPNAVEFERFADDSVSVPDDPALGELRKNAGPVAGYYGALASWFDYALLDEVAKRRPDWRFVLIGPDYDGSIFNQALLRRPNVYWLGPRAYPQLPGYLKLFDVAMIPFAINDITLATSPLKLYEYLAAGKTVVTTPMPECQAYPEVLIARNADQFARALDSALHSAGTESYRQQARQVARQNSWAVRAEHVLGMLAQNTDARSLAS